MDWILTGLTLGFVGSVHCVGMCGPLALMLPGKDAARWRFLGERLLYNLGRTLTYTLLGVAFGALGLFVALTGYQQWLSMGVGVVLLLAAVVPWMQRYLGRLEQLTAGTLKRVVQWIQQLYRRGGSASMLTIGVLNGLLPCGLVYAAIATAVTAGTVTGSAAFMASFGLGTIPAMFAVALAGGLLSVTWRTRLRKLIPVALAVLGILLILRGLSLGVFLSPDLREALFTPGTCRFLPLVDPV